MTQHKSGNLVSKAWQFQKCDPKESESPNLPHQQPLLQAQRRRWIRKQVILRLHPRRKKSVKMKRRLLSALSPVYSFARKYFTHCSRFVVDPKSALQHTTRLAHTGNYTNFRFHQPPSSSHPRGGGGASGLEETTTERLSIQPSASTPFHLYWCGKITAYGGVIGDDPITTFQIVCCYMIATHAYTNRVKGWATSLSPTTETDQRHY